MRPTPWYAPLLLGLALGLSGCTSSDSQSFDNAAPDDGGNNNDSGSGDPLVGDEARRAVLADIGEDLILPALAVFQDRADGLRQALDQHAAAPTDGDALAAARTAWQAAMVAWQRNEPLQFGPAGRASGIDATPGGANLRSQIYGFPLLTPCSIDQAALDGSAVDENTPIDIKGLGALEYLLYREGSNPDCPPPAGADLTASRAALAARIGVFIAGVAADLHSAWRPDAGNFIGEWRSAGAGSQTYMNPQAALDALSVALFYVEKDTKDLKIANPTGIGATGLTPCPDSSCPERLESPLSQRSGAHIAANLQAFRDVFTGVDGGMGVNHLLRGIDRDDLADDLITRLDATLARLQGITPDFDTAVAAIPSNSDCINASANRTDSGDPALAACALHGDIKAAMDLFRGPIVSALSLATPNRAAGDND